MTTLDEGGELHTTSVYSGTVRSSVSGAADVAGAHKHPSPHIGQIDSGEKLDADRMDEKRKEHMAYEYLCHLEEAKQWIEACIEDELPATTELEEALRNGVILGRLGHFYAPDILPLRKIYDRDQAKYHAKGLHFKHTDNFNWWIRTLEHVGLPKIFYPITTDLYDRKNMPRVIYCIHALSLYLHKLGKAPLIEDLLGTATFTEEEISAMKLALEKYGISLPSFGKIGGILANELSMDEAAVHAAVMAINEVLEKEDSDETFKALQNPAACLVDVLSENAPRYQVSLLKSKRDKSTSAGLQRTTVDDSERDVYEYMLTRDEIQRGVAKVNSAVRAEIAEEKFCRAIGVVNEAIVSGDIHQLLQTLQCEDTRLNGVQPENLQWYMDVLSKAVKDKVEMGGESHLTRDEIQDIINIANDIAEHTRLVQAAVVAINSALEDGDADSTLEALQDEHLDLSDVHPEHKEYYYRGLREKKESCGGSLLTEDDIQDGVHDMNRAAEYDRNVEEAFEAINYNIKSGKGAQATLHVLQSEFAGMVGIIREDCAEEYHDALKQAQEEKGDNLTSEEIKQIIEVVNEKKHQEELLAQAVSDINTCLDEEDSSLLLSALLSVHAGLNNVEEKNALHYVTVLRALKMSKQERQGISDAQLTQGEIQAGIDKANEQTLEAIELAKAVSLINSAVDSGDPAATLSALQAPAASIRSVTEECATDYAESLTAAKSEKGGEEGEGWVEHRTREGNTFYYNWKTQQSQWEIPEGVPEKCSHLRREEIQVVVTKVTADFDRWTLLMSNEPLIIQLQARVRGNLCRKPFLSRLEFLREHEKQAVALQAHWKGSKQRKAYQERLDFLKSQAEIATKLQSYVRMWRARRAHRQRLKYFKDNVGAVIKIQAFWRAKSAKRDYKQLVEVDQPPASSVRRFLALLEQSDIDFSEELECQRLKAQVVQEIRSNQQLEQDVQIMDIKIGLLVKNRISLEDVVTHSSQIKKERRRGGASVVATGDSSTLSTAGLGGLTKANQQRVEAYQHLFYLLQTNPNYFAKLIFEMPQSKTNRFMENVILTVFNYAQNNREQFLLVKLFERALKEEIESKVDRIMDIVTGNPTVIKMVIHYTRGERGHNVLRDLLGPLVKEILEAKDLMLITSPVDVYHAWINQMESETGEATKLPYDVSNDQALEHEEVRVRIRKTIQQLCSFCDRFQTSIMESVHKIPYAMRLIAMQLRLALLTKFPDTPQDDILKVVGNLLYYRYMNPAIVAPDAFDVVEVGVDHQLGAEQRRNLGAIAKILQTAAAGKVFEGENAALSNMNEYLTTAFEKFKVFFLQASTVPSAEEKFGIDEYSDVIMLTKPVIYISVKEICSTHSLLIEHEEVIAPDPSDALREILRDLGPAPSVEAFLGGVREAAPGEDKQDVINEAGKQEIPLTLVNKFEGLAQDDSSDMRALFVRTKRMVVDVLKVQPGDNLTEILYTPASPEQEEEHQQLIRKREISEQTQMLRSKTIKKSDSMSGDRNLPLEGMKRKIMRNLRTLETEGMVNSKNDYQEVINAIAKDIRNQHRYRQQRKQELARLQETLNRLSAKATFYEEQIEYYHKYVKACLDNLAQAGGKGSKVRGSATEFKKQSIKYTAQKLHEKGVILEIEGLPTHQFKNAVFEITSKDIGTFEVTGKFFGVSMEKVELVFQDLLQLQYEGLAVMKMFGRAKINVNLLIYLINKKFYGIQK